MVAMQPCVAGSRSRLGDVLWGVGHMVTAFFARPSPFPPPGAISPQVVFWLTDEVRHFNLRSGLASFFPCGETLEKSGFAFLKV